MPSLRLSADFGMVCDPAFGGDGLVETSIPDGLSAHGLADQDDGRLVVAGELGGDAGFLLLRFLG